MAPPVNGTLVDALKSAQDFRTGSITIDLNYYTGFLSTRNVVYGRDSNARLFNDPSNGGRYTLYNAVAAGQSFDTNLYGSANTGWSRNAVDGGRALAFRVPEYRDSANPHLWLSYVSFGTWLFDEHNPRGISLSLRKVNDYFYFGIPTAAADLPTTGTASLEGIVQGKLYAADAREYDLQGTATFYADFSAQAFSTQLIMSGTGRDFSGTLDIGKLVGGGQISSDSRFRGIWTESANGYSGSILGSFFGPQAQEFGYSFGINNAGLTALGGGSVIGGVPVNAPPGPPVPPPPLPPAPPPPAPTGSTFPLQDAQTFDTISETLRYNGRGVYTFNDTPVGVTRITVTPDFEKGTYSISNDVASTSFETAQLPVLPDPGQNFVSFATPLAANTPYLGLYILNNLAPESGTNAPALQFHYLSFGGWQQHNERDNNSHSITSFLYGTRTASTDMPKTGTANYSLLVQAQSTAGYVSYIGDGALTANFASGELSTRIDVYGSSIGGLYDFPYARMTGTGTITSGSANFTGQLAATNNSYSGSFKGAFFGPGAPEVGLTFSVKGQFGLPGVTSEQRMIGIAVGRKDP